ncbi:MAG TPA: DUF1902 domain-containing protein [Stellaceae bacterium]|nr:DUF1902 domain-containing protein [Stellaceae bacterium]
MAKTQFSVSAHWDADADLWWSSCDEAPLATEAPTFEELLENVVDLVPEIIALNERFKPGDAIEILMQAKRSEALVLREGSAEAATLSWRRVMSHLAPTPLRPASKDRAARDRDIFVVSSPARAVRFAP